METMQKMHPDCTAADGCLNFWESATGAFIESYSDHGFMLHFMNASTRSLAQMKTRAMPLYDIWIKFYKWYTQACHSQTSPQNFQDGIWTALQGLIVSLLDARRCPSSCESGQPTTSWRRRLRTDMVDMYSSCGRAFSFIKGWHKQNKLRFVRLLRGLVFSFLCTWGCTYP